MKKNTRLVAFILCLLLAVCLTGCGKDAEPKPAPTTVPTSPPPTTQPPPPPASQVYDQARQALDGAQNITLAVTVTQYITVNGDEFSEKSVQTLTYQGLGTQNVAADMDAKLSYSVHSEEELTEEEKKDREESAIAYREIFADGMLYAEIDDGSAFCAAAQADDVLARYTPVVLLDAALYGDISYGEAAQGTKLVFTQPSAAESWAIPEEAAMTDASGSVLLDEAGTITQMDYTLSYTYGPAEIQLEVQAAPKAEAAQVAAPEKADSYHTVTDLDALYLSVRSMTMLAQADSISSSGVESLMSEAAAFMRNQSTQASLHGRNEDTISKVEYSIFTVDYRNESQQYEQEETYVDGRLTTVVNGGLPTSKSGVAWEDVREDTSVLFFLHSVPAEYWEDVTITDMGTVYLLEFSLTENFGNMIQNSICSMLWNDPSFLYNMASKYETGEVNGYLSIDKFIGVPVAGGYYYEGFHTIEGEKFKLSMQMDQSLDAPCLGAYQEITGERPPVEEPENKATPLFYHVTGENGQEMWLLGTIHVGDARTEYLPKEIRAAFDASDALALECNTEAFDKQAEEDEKIQKKISKAYYYSGKTNLKTLLGEEEYARALQFAKATGTYNMNLPQAKPYLWSNGIDNFYRHQAQSLHGDWGVEEQLMDWAEETEKPIWEIESNLFQIEMLTGFSNELQLKMLRDSMEMTAQEYWEDLQALYELWCAGDEAALREEISDKVDISTMTAEELAEYEQIKPLLEEYNKAVSYDRNEGMLKAAKKYLESGDTVFYAVGLAHLLDDTNGLVDALREAGYTVELVTYE